MHHIKKFSKYPTRKKIAIVVALIYKFVLFGLVFAGLAFSLKNYLSSGILMILVHVILLGCIFIFFIIHKHKNKDHEDNCKCE